MVSFLGSSWRGLVSGLIAAIMLMCLSRLIADQGYWYGFLSAPWFAGGVAVLQSMRVSDSRKEATFPAGRDQRAFGWVLGGLSALSLSLLLVELWSNALILPYSVRTLWCVLGLMMGGATTVLAYCFVRWLRSTPEPAPPPLPPGP